MNIESGTISHGTLRAEDLIPTFLSVLRDCSPARVASIVDEYGSAFVERCCEPNGFDEATPNEFEARDYLFEQLFDALGDIAPEGMYFGTIEGDGSDFGFWGSEEEEE